jgi:carbamoyltransferase
MIGRRFEGLFGAAARKPEGPIEQVHMDAAASIQAVTEEIVLRAARHVHEKTGMKNLALSGGVALNCVANGRLLREGPFENIWIQPAAGDAGGALGAALFVWYQLLGNDRRVSGGDLQAGSLLGPAYGSEQVRGFLDGRGVPYRRFEDEHELLEEVADMLAAGKIVGWFQGRMEFGPRALGGRSILADARGEDVQDAINNKVKFREPWRPFAPCVLAGDVREYFDLDTESPYMLLVAAVNEKNRLPLAAADQALRGLEKARARRSRIPAVTHVDFSARVQTVDAERHRRLHRLLEIFKAKTGCSVLVNTSFNVRGEPIVCTPQDAYDCFAKTGLDAVVMEDVLVQKT